MSRRVGGVAMSRSMEQGHDDVPHDGDRLRRRPPPDPSGIVPPRILIPGAAPRSGMTARPASLPGEPRHPGKPANTVQITTGFVSSRSFPCAAGPRLRPAHRAVSSFRVLGWPGQLACPGREASGGARRAPARGSTTADPAPLAAAPPGQASCPGHPSKGDHPVTSLKSPNTSQITTGFVSSRSFPCASGPRLRPARRAVGSLRDRPGRSRFANLTLSRIRR
jgi:hypothetical protein